MLCRVQLSFVSCSCEYCSFVPSYLVSSGPYLVVLSIVVLSHPILCPVVCNLYLVVLSIVVLSHPIL